MKKVIGWIGVIGSGVVYAISWVISVWQFVDPTDLAKILGVSTEIMSLKLLSVLLFVLSTVGIMLIVDRSVLLNAVEKNVEDIRDKSIALGIKSREMLQLMEKSYELSLHLANERQLYQDSLDLAGQIADLEKVPGADIFEGIAIDYLRDCKDKIYHLFIDHVELDPLQHTDDYLSLYPKSKTRIKAVSYDNGVSYGDRQETFWEGEVGKKVLRANSEARDRDVDITRIFILTPDQVKNPRVIFILNQQRDAGVRVLIADPQKTPPDLIDDYGILDDSLVFQMDITKDMKGKGYLSLNKEEVKKKTKSFESLKAFSQNLEDFRNSKKGMKK